MCNVKNYFSWSEFTTTNTGLLNNPTTPVHLVNLAYLWKYLNFLREKIGAPIFINSAFRTPDVNRKVGGSENSYHMLGLAADITTVSSKMDSLRELLLLHYDNADPNGISEFIDYGTYFHIAL